MMAYLTRPRQGYENGGPVIPAAKPSAEEIKKIQWNNKLKLLKKVRDGMGRRDWLNLVSEHLNDGVEEEIITREQFNTAISPLFGQAGEAHSRALEREDSMPVKDLLEIQGEKREDYPAYLLADGGRAGFSGGSLEEEYYGPQKLDWKANYPDLTWEEYLRFKSSGSFADGGRIKAADGIAVQTLNPLFPTKDPTDTESFKPLDLPGAIIPPLAIGAGAKRIKDIFFSKDKGEDKKEIVERIEKVEKDRKDPDQEPPDYKQMFRDFKTINEFRKYFQQKEEDFKKVPSRWRASKFDDEYLTGFEEFKNKFFDGSLSAASKYLNEDLKMGTGSFKERIRKSRKTHPNIITQTLESGPTTSVLDIEPSTNSFKAATNLIRHKPEIIKEKIDLLIKDGKLKKDGFYNLKTLADVFGIDRDNVYAVQTLGTNLKDLDVVNEKGRGPNKSERFFKLGDATSKLIKWSEGKYAYGQGTGIVAPRERYQLMKKLDNPLRNLFTRFNQQIRKISKDVDVYQPGALEDIGHPMSIKIADKYSTLLKGSNINDIQTLVFQDPVVNQKILVGEGFENQYYKIFDKLKKFNNKEITKDNRLELLNIKKEMEDNYNNIINSIVSRQEDNPYFRGQEKRIPKISVDVPKIGQTFKGSNIFADMSTVDSEFQVGKVSEYNKKAKKYNDLSNEEKALYNENLKDQFSDGLEKYYTAVGYGAEEIADLLESFETGTDTFMRLPKEKGGPVYGKYAKQIAGIS